MPFGTAHETATPSRSRRRSQCSRVALCSCTTKRLPGEPAPVPGPGSGVAPKSRFARYSPNSSGVRVARRRNAFFADDFTALHDLVGVTVLGLLLLGLLGKAVEGGRVLAVLCVVAQHLL